jgi:hypothetical protein
LSVSFEFHFYTGFAISVIGFSKFLGGFVITITYFAGAVQKLECEFLFIEIQQHPSCQNLMAKREKNVRNYAVVVVALSSSLIS